LNIVWLIEMSKYLQILTPFMLRRLKSDVDFVIPPKREVVVYAPLFVKQQEMYRCILDKTIAHLVGGPKEPQVYTFYKILFSTPVYRRLYHSCVFMYVVSLFESLMCIHTK